MSCVYLYNRFCMTWKRLFPRSINDFDDERRAVIFRWLLEKKKKKNHLRIEGDSFLVYNIFFLFVTHCALCVTIAIIHEFCYEKKYFFFINSILNKKKNKQTNLYASWRFFRNQDNLVRWINKRLPNFQLKIVYILAMHRHLYIYIYLNWIIEFERIEYPYFV